jgi:hypothetical protein
MKKSLKLLCTAAPAVFLLLCCTAKAFALTEAEVQAQVDAVGKEAVTGNVLIWFLCAIAFLKVSHKMDSLIHALGITTGHTGGSVMAELMIAARSISAVRGGHRHGGSSGGTSDNPGFFQGGLAGVVSRGIEHGASQSATGNGSGGIGGKVYSSSLSKGGSFANRVIGNIATGSISSTGTISGENAAGALMSYLGYTALGEGAADVPSFSNVEIGGGHITGVETSDFHPEGISFGMYYADQYAAPQGNYETVHTIDGNTWYKQYAADTVERTPYNAPDGTVAYNESIVKKLPPPPIRKDRI